MQRQVCVAVNSVHRLAAINGNRASNLDFFPSVLGGVLRREHTVYTLQNASSFELDCNIRLNMIFSQLTY